MFSFCSYEVKPNSIAGSPIFLLAVRPERRAVRCVDFGEKVLRKADGFREPNRLNAPSATIRR